MRRAAETFALALLASTVALAGASAAEQTSPGPAPGHEIAQGASTFGQGIREGAVNIGHGVRNSAVNIGQGVGDAAVNIGHNVRDGAVNAWGAVKSAFNGTGK